MKSTLIIFYCLLVIVIVARSIILEKVPAIPNKKPVIMFQHRFAENDCADCDGWSQVSIGETSGATEFGDGRILEVVEVDYSREDTVFVRTKIHSCLKWQVKTLDYPRVEVDTMGYGWIYPDSVWFPFDSLKVVENNAVVWRFFYE